VRVRVCVCVYWCLHDVWEEKTRVGRKDMCVKRKDWSTERLISILQPFSAVTPILPPLIMQPSIMSLPFCVRTVGARLFPARMRRGVKTYIRVMQTHIDVRRDHGLTALHTRSFMKANNVCQLAFRKANNVCVRACVLHGCCAHWASTCAHMQICLCR